MAKRPKYTSREISRHGRPQWYYRRYGRRVRLPDEFGTDEWWQAYDAAASGKTPLVTKSSRGSFAALVRAYMESRPFNELAKNTRMQRAAIFRDAIAKAGNAAPDAVTESSIRQVMVSKPPFAANNFLKAMRGFYKWAIEMGYVTDNPTVNIKRNNPKSDGWKIWTPEAIQQFREYWYSKADEYATWEKGCAVLTCHYIALKTGLRRSDLIRLGPKHDKGDYFEIRTEKTGVICYIPITLEMRTEFIHQDNSKPYLTRESGKPFPSAETLGNWFREACQEAGIPDGMRLHSLRKTAATMDAEDGWTASELMAKYGWLDIREAELYTKQADRKRLALGAGTR